MNSPTPPTRLLLACFCLLSLSRPTLQLANAGEDMIDFSRQIRPILSDKCFKCHGPDESSREGDLRLDREDAAKSGTVGQRAG